MTGVMHGSCRRSWIAAPVLAVRRFESLSLRQSFAWSLAAGQTDPNKV